DRPGAAAPAALAGALLRRAGGAARARAGARRRTAAGAGGGAAPGAPPGAPRPDAGRGGRPRRAGTGAVPRRLGAPPGGRRDVRRAAALRPRPAARPRLDDARALAALRGALRGRAGWRPALTPRAARAGRPCQPEAPHPAGLALSAAGADQASERPTRGDTRARGARRGNGGALRLSGGRACARE